MIENHPITPLPELVGQWHADWYQLNGKYIGINEYLATQAARWGADQELEACCAWLQDPDLNVDTYKLRAARRPRSPSLAKEALEAQQRVWNGDSTHADWELIRAALERLQELEQSND